MENYDFVKVKDHQNLMRDPTSNGIMNTNRSEYDEYKSRQKKAESMEEDLAELKSEMNEIKQLLRNLANGN